MAGHYHPTARNLLSRPPHRKRSERGRASSEVRGVRAGDRPRALSAGPTRSSRSPPPNVPRAPAAAGASPRAAGWRWPPCADPPAATPAIPLPRFRPPPTLRARSARPVARGLGGVPRPVPPRALDRRARGSDARSRTPSRGKPRCARRCAALCNARQREVRAADAGG